MNIALCFCVRDCEPYLKDIFKNIDLLKRTKATFYTIFIHDNCTDNSPLILEEYKKNNKNVIVRTIENTSNSRTERIAKARNTCLQIVYNELKDISFHIMIDSDNACSAQWNVDIINKYLNNSDDWDSISFNRDHFYDIWALMFDDFKHHCWGFNHSTSVIQIMQKNIIEKLGKCKESIDVISAFNGFAIYKTSKYKGLYYDGLYKNLKQIISDDDRKNTIESLKKFNIHTQINDSIESCEHLFYHVSAHKKGLKMKISKHKAISSMPIGSMTNDFMPTGSTIEDFNNLWGQISKSTAATEATEATAATAATLALEKKIYEVAYNLMNSPIPPINKEEIIYKMLFLYPNDCDLYYKAAELHAEINQIKAITWHKMGYQIDPNNDKNTLALCLSLYENDFGNQVMNMNNKGQLDKFMNNIKFLKAHNIYNCKNLKYENSIKSLLKLIEIHSKKTAITQEEKSEKWQNYHDIGYVYSKLGQIDNAARYIQKATDLAVKFNLSLKQQTLTFSNLAMINCYRYHNNDEIYNLHLKINSYYPNKETFDFSKRPRNSKIRLGYVSSDLDYHPIANFLLPIIDNHTDAFEVTLFSNIKDVAHQFKKPNRKIIDITSATEYEAAKLIYNEKIDILFDLNGHTGSNRLGIFAQNPAPIQISYLGYANTSGLKSIKYRLTDKISNPENSTEKYSEKLLYLPKCFLLYKNISSTDAIRPDNFVLGQRPIILAALNTETKNSIDTLRVWAKILNECPNTRLLIKLESHDNKEDRTKFYIKNLDTSEDRLIILNRLSNYDYDMIFSKIDVLLDTFPYSGTTTTCNALFNSVPVVTLYDPNNHCHSVSSSILINTGLPELVANTHDEYVNIVKRLSDSNILNKYKSTIKNKFTDLMNPATFIKSYESILVSITQNPANAPPHAQQKIQTLHLNV